MVKKGAGRVLVLGSGISGVAAALELRAAGCDVVLAEQSDRPGGHAALLGCKATDVCLRCNVCVAHELIRQICQPQQHLHLLTGFQLKSITAGSDRTAYVAAYTRQTPAVNVQRCTECGACYDFCPNRCFAPPSSGIVQTPAVDSSRCLRHSGDSCQLCREQCPVGAVSLEDDAAVQQQEIDYILVATGYQAYDPHHDHAYHYGQAANVLTGLDLEKSLNSGRRSIRRPSDNEPPKRIAFIQCVGSRSRQVHRTPEETNYCSVVCCAYGLRSAKLLKHLDPELEITVFYMDVQFFGRDFEEFLQESRKEFRFVRARPYELNERENGDIQVVYEDQGSCRTQSEDYEMVILSTGIRANPDNYALAEIVGLPIDENGFFEMQAQLQPFATGAGSGIYVSGTCENPADIETTIVQARAVAHKIMREVEAELSP